MMATDERIVVPHHHHHHHQLPRLECNISQVTEESPSTTVRTHLRAVVKNTINIFLDCVCV
jgi:hypothetical protein